MGSTPIAASSPQVLPSLPLPTAVVTEQIARAESESVDIATPPATGTNVAESATPTSIPVQPAAAAQPVAAGLLLAWGLGFALLLVPLVRSAWALRRLSRRSELTCAAPLARMVQAVSAELRLREDVIIHIGSEDAMPMAWGIWRPHLLLPSAAATWQPTRLRAVLLHELAHLQRRDPFTLLLGQLARAVHWFNPLAWLAVHRLRAEQELACDDCVLRAGVRPSDYASDVLEIAIAQRVLPATAPMALSMASPARLECRIRMIVGAAVDRTAVTRWLIAGAALAAVAFALPLAMVRAADPKPETISAATGEPQTGPESAKGPVQPADPVRTIVSPGLVFDRGWIVAMSSQEARYLDLDTGKLVPSHPPGDIVQLPGESDVRVPAGLDMIAIAGHWEATPEEVLRALSTATSQKQVRIGGREGKRIWFYKTSEGSTGTFEISADERTGRVLIRNKALRPRRAFEPVGTVILPSSVIAVFCR